MGLYVTLSFPDGKGTDPLPGLVVHRYHIRDAMSELYDLTLQVASTQGAAVNINGEPINLNC